MTKPTDRAIAHSWRPISDAPGSGGLLLWSRADGLCIGFHNDGQWWESCRGRLHPIHPTHFAELPFPLDEMIATGYLKH